jgi:hypothetical protein
MRFIFPCGLIAAAIAATALCISQHIGPYTLLGFPVLALWAVSFYKLLEALFDGRS